MLSFIYRLVTHFEQQYLVRPNNLLYRHSDHVNQLRDSFQTLKISYASSNCSRWI